MTKSPTGDLFEQVVQKIAPTSKLLRTWDLKGGVSAHVTALEIEQSNGQTKKMIVRRHGEVDLKHNPQIAADEFKLLRLLQSAGLAVPAPYGLDQSCEIFPTPYLVIEYIEGTSAFALSNETDQLLQLATQFFKIHNLDCSTFDLSFLPSQTVSCAEKLRERPIIVDDSLEEGHIRDLLESVWPVPQQNRSVLLHGDFWPGNVLWQAGQLVGVIDWEDAQIGDPLADLANTRLEILWAFGIDAMHRFTQQYQSMTTIDFTNLPYWDLWAALRPASKIGDWAADEIIEKTMRERHALFTTQAFEQLSHRG